MAHTRRHANQQPPSERERKNSKLIRQWVLWYASWWTRTRFHAAVEMHRVVGKASRESIQARESIHTYAICFHYDVCAVPVVDIKNMNVETSRGPFSESAPAKGVIFVGPRGAPVVSIIRWIDIHIGSCSARNTPLVGGNAPSAERDKRGGSWEMQRGAETCTMSTAGPETKERFIRL